jgi:hypothetical protein
MRWMIRGWSLASMWFIPKPPVLSAVWSGTTKPRSPDFASALLFDEADNVTIYVCNAGFRLYDFNFKDEIPTAAALQRICDEALKAYMQLQDIYREQEAAGFELRELRALPSKPLAPVERSKAIAELKLLALDACQKPLRRLHLTALVQQTLSAGDWAVLTESQLGLQGEPKARDMLLQTARDCIAFPEVVRKDGSILSFELWGLPLAFSRAQGGVWWHFPLLERVEPVLADALELAPRAILWMSPTLFTVDMLNERACQDLVNIAPVMDAGCDYAPYDPESSRATFDAARQTHDPQMVVAFIPFLVERGALPMDQARRCARKTLEAVMPLVQEAISAEMEFGEAELFCPLPWWDALTAGIGGMNRKRLGMALALAHAHLGEGRSLVAQAEYQPELQGYELTFKQEGRDEAVARTVWMLVSDVAPDRERAWADLASCLRDARIPLTENIARLH